MLQISFSLITLLLLSMLLLLCIACYRVHLLFQKLDFFIDVSEEWKMNGFMVVVLMWEILRDKPV